MSAARDLLKQALALDPEDRAEIAQELLDSLAPPQAWAEGEGTAELERRARRVVEQGSRGAPWPEVRAAIERELKR
jgi:putative addiction module component (TIGR02574 family)